MRTLHCAFTLVICLFAASPSAADVLTIATVSDNTLKSIKTFEPLASYLERELLSDGVTKVRIAVVPNTDAIIEAMQNGSIDLYIGSPIVAAQIFRSAGGKPVLRRWKDQIASDQSLVVVRSDSGVETLQDLRGNVIGFDNRMSDFGFLLAADLLRSAGLGLQELPSRYAMPPQADVGFVFTGAENDTLAWIYKGWIDAAALRPASFDRLASAAPDDFRIVGRSMDVPHETVVLSIGLETRIAESIERRLVNMSETEQGRQVLAAFDDTTRFDSFPDGFEATFAPIYALLDRMALQDRR